MQSDEQDIRKLVVTWIMDSQAGDSATVCPMTGDVVFLTPGHPPMLGKSAFAAASKAQAEPPFQLSGANDIQEIQVFGEWLLARNADRIRMMRRPSSKPSEPQKISSKP